MKPLKIQIIEQQNVLCNITNILNLDKFRILSDIIVDVETRSIKFDYQSKITTKQRICEMYCILEPLKFERNRLISFDQFEKKYSVFQ